jgi:hypothetical protein
MFFSFTSFSLGEQKNPKTSDGHLFDGLWLNYTFVSGGTFKAVFTYTHVSGTLYNVTWWNEGDPPPGVYWIEDTATRLTSSSSGGFGSGVHTPLWIFTNLTIGNSTTIVVDGGFDHAYTVVGEANVNYPGFGSFGVWVLEDDIYSTQAWYDKNTGILINGTFQWFGGSYTLGLTATNLFPPPGDDVEIPAYEIFLVLPIIGIISFFVLKKRLKMLKVK